jgi:hypothetical protein
MAREVLLKYCGVVLPDGPMQKAGEAIGSEFDVVQSQ